MANIQIIVIGDQWLAYVKSWHMISFRIDELCVQEKNNLTSLDRK